MRVKCRLRKASCRRPVTLQGYALLAAKAIKEVADTSVMLYAHSYMLLYLSLMARSCSISHLKYEQFSWLNDALAVHLPMHKGDQDGSNSYPPHVRALALVILIYFNNKIYPACLSSCSN